MLFALKENRGKNMSVLADFRIWLKAYTCIFLYQMSLIWKRTLSEELF